MKKNHEHIYNLHTCFNYQNQNENLHCETKRASHMVDLLLSCKNITNVICLLNKMWVLVKYLYTILYTIHNVQYIQYLCISIFVSKFLQAFKVDIISFFDVIWIEWRPHAEGQYWRIWKEKQTCKLFATLFFLQELCLNSFKETKLYVQICNT